MSNYRTLEEVSVEYFAQHPDEIEAFLNEIFAEYAQDGDSAALLDCGGPESAWASSNPDNAATVQTARPAVDKRHTAMVTLLA